MARRRPSTLEGFRHVKGVGEKKLADHGQSFVDRIVAYCRGNKVSMDVEPEVVAPAASRSAESRGPTMSAIGAFKLFRQGLNVQQVAQQMDRATSTVYGYLAEYIGHEKITDPSPWVDAATVERVTQAARQVGTERLKPIFELLDGQVSYEQIRIVVLCLKQAGQGQANGL
jgi:ATP-dependent DNA helicase RecQ